MSAYSALLAASTIWVLCRMLRRPLALRFFGDSLYFTYHRYGPAHWRKHWMPAVPCPRAANSECSASVCPTPTLPLFNGHPRAIYGGVLAPEEASRVLAEYDLLLFLGYMRSEGTLGGIIEAFQCDVPVVETSIGGVAEQVEHEKSGLLVVPHSVPELKAAIQQLIDGPALYRRLCAGARQRGEFFRCGRHFDRLVEELRSLARECTKKGLSRG